MKKLTAIFFATLIIFSIGCKQEGVIETQNQKYYVAELVGDPNNRNILRATTVWSEDAAFEILMPDYWEVKIDEDDKYNTDIYLSSNEYDDDTCVVLPGTIGYGVSEELEKEQWATLTTWGAADDWYFYETVDGVRRPVFRTATFTDENGNYYIFEVQFPEENWESCNANYSDMIATFNTLQSKLEDTYIDTEIFQEKWKSVTLPLLADTDKKFVIDYPPSGWAGEDSEEGYDILVDNENSCSVHAGVPLRDIAEAASYEEDVLVLDNNEMAKRYKLYDAQGLEYMEIVTFTYQDSTYNFELQNMTEANKDICTSNFESIVKSFRTYDEEIDATSGYDVFAATGTSTVSE